MRSPATQQELHAAEHEVAEAAVAMYEAEHKASATWEGDHDSARAHGAAIRRFRAAVQHYATIRPTKEN